MTNPILQSLWSELDPMLKQYKVEIEELRALPGTVDTKDDFASLHARFLSSRQALDRMEEIVASLGMLKSRLKKLVSELDEAYEDAWRETMQRTRVGEYTSAKERDATYAAGAIEELVRLRKAKKLQIDVEETYDYALMRYRGLDSARRDTDSLLRLTTVDSVMGR